MEDSPPSSRLRWFFLAICGCLLALLAVSGLVALRLLGEIRREEQAANHVLADRSRMLSDVLLAVQKHNRAVAHALTEEKADRQRIARRKADQLAVEIDADFRQYPAPRDAEEASLIQQLQNVFSEQRIVYVSVLSAPPQDRRTPAAAAAEEEMNRLQTEILDWTAKLKAWDGERIRDSGRQLASEFGSAQSGLTRALAIIFGSGFLLVMAGMTYIVRLERQTHKRYLQLAQSRREMQQLSARLVDAQEAERRTISRELHDEVGQALGALLVDVSRLSTTLSNERPEVTAQLENMKSVAERTFQEIRNIALLLRPSMLDDLGLVAALEWQAREISRRSNVEVEVESGIDSDDLPDEYRICIYRLVQEALNNAVRHAGARNASVAVNRTAKSIVVKVRDDGRGFDPQRARGLGILGMEERVKRVGGTFKIDSQEGRGAIVTAELPVPPGNGLPS